MIPAENPILIKHELKNKSGKVYCRLAYDVANDYNLLTWNGYSSVEDVKAGLEEGLKLLSSNACRGMLHDTRLSTGLWHEANEWILHHWTPRAFQKGLTKSAIIVSTNIFSAMSAQQLVATQTH